MRRAKRTLDELRSTSPAFSKEEEKQTIGETAEPPNPSTDASPEEQALFISSSFAKKKSLFWRIYSVVVATFLLIVLAAILLVHSMLADYESARPGYVAEEVFANYFQTEDPTKLLEKSGLSLSVFETPEDFGTFWNEQTQGRDLSLLRVSADNGSETVRYNVRVGEKTLAAFELSLSTEKTFYQNPLYELSKIELGVSATESIRIAAPSDSTVRVNGIELNSSKIVEENVETASCAHMPEGVLGLTYHTYEITGLFCTPEITAVDSRGQVHQLNFDEQKEAYVASVNYDDQLQAEMSEYAIEAAQTFAATMQNDRPRSAALSYIDSQSELYRQTSGISLWVSAHSGYRFEDVSASEFYSYDKNTFSCRVSFIHVLTGGSTRFDAKGENRENVDITWYFRKVGDKFLIYDRENN